MSVTEKRSNGFILVFDLDQTLIDTIGCIPRHPNGRVNIEAFSAILDACEADPEGYANELMRRFINHKIVNQVLRPATRIRDTRRGVSAILLLTNNASHRYVNIVCGYLARQLGSPGDFERVRQDPVNGDPSIRPIPGGAYVFDYVMMRNNPFRVSRGDVNSKNVLYVRHMLQSMIPPVTGIDTMIDLAKRTYFFDDSPVRHRIYDELFAPGVLDPAADYSDHYFTITGLPGTQLPGYINRGGGDNDDTTDYRFIGFALDEVEAGVAPEGFGGGGRRRRGRKTTKARKTRRRRGGRTRSGNKK